MPRNRPGLGQGLKALVPPPRPEETGERSTPGDREATAWEYVALSPKGRKGHGSRVTLIAGNIVDQPKPRIWRGVPPLLALGVLGANGWELVTMRRGTFFLKRAVRA